MNKPTLSRLKIRPPLILMGLILVGALLLPVTDMFSNPAAAAVTASECYDYNNTTSGVSTNPTGPKQECVNAGYCTSAFSSGTGGVSGSAGGTVMRFTCSDEVYKASSQYAATAYNQGVLDAQIAPALKTICGDASTSTRGVVFGS